MYFRRSGVFATLFAAFDGGLLYLCRMSSKYEKQRARVIPPHVSIKTLRKVSGMTLEQVCFRMNQFLETPDRVKPGTLSGLENGHRGASVELIESIEYAYGLNQGELTTAYLPRQTRDLADAS